MEEILHHLTHLGCIVRPMWIDDDTSNVAGKTFYLSTGGRISSIKQYLSKSPMLHSFFQLHPPSYNKKAPDTISMMRQRRRRSRWRK